jgi:prepilin-type N-terminal cleavage/methylation domain-containing protein
MKKQNSGFSIVELMVVVAIMGILLSIVLYSIMDARRNARDERRVSDLSNIALAMTLYKEKNRGYPVAPSGIEIGRGGTLDGPIQQLNGNTYADPLGTGTYGYWYYSDVLCNGKLVNAVVAKSMEKGSNSNYEEVCGSSGAMVPESPKFALIPKAYASHKCIENGYSGGGFDQGDSCPNNIVQQGHTTIACSAGMYPSVVTLPQSGSVQTTVSWGVGNAAVNLVWPNGHVNYLAGNVDSGFPVTITSSMQPGQYIVEVYPNANNLGQTESNRCSVGLQVNPAVVSTQCNDSTDNDGDGLTDSSDPGCHVGGVLSGAYDATIDSEVNTIAPPAPTGATFPGTYIIVLK